MIWQDMYMELYDYEMFTKWLGYGKRCCLLGITINSSLSTFSFTSSWRCWSMRRGALKLNSRWGMLTRGPVLFTSFAVTISLYFLYPVRVRSLLNIMCFQFLINLIYIYDNWNSPFSIIFHLYLIKKINYISYPSSIILNFT